MERYTEKGVGTAAMQRTSMHRTAPLYIALAVITLMMVTTSSAQWRVDRIIATFTFEQMEEIIPANVEDARIAKLTVKALERIRVFYLRIRISPENVEPEKSITFPRLLRWTDDKGDVVSGITDVEVYRNSPESIESWTDITYHFGFTSEFPEPLRVEGEDEEVFFLVAGGTSKYTGVEVIIALKQFEEGSVWVDDHPLSPGVSFGDEGITQGWKVIQPEQGMRIKAGPPRVIASISSEGKVATSWGELKNSR